MRLVILGSGTSVPHAQRASAAFWLQTNEGSLLLDVSADAPHRMAQEQLDWPNLDAVWVSHFHLDHIGGLPNFLWATRHAPQTQQRRKPLRIFGPPGLKRIFDLFNQASNNRLMDQPFPIELVEVSLGATISILPGLTARTFSTRHTPESMAIRLTEKDRVSVVYSSDTGVSPGLVDFCKGANLLLLECSFPRNKPTEKHLELSDAIELARECQPQRLVLTHLYPEWDKIDLVHEAKKLWSGETIEAKDGLCLEF